MIDRSVRVSVRSWRDLKALDPVIEGDVGVLLGLTFPSGLSKPTSLDFSSPSRIFATRRALTH